MQIFVTGASGAIGRRLVRQLVARGHEVLGAVHSAAGAKRLSAVGAEPIELDLLDALAVRDALIDARPNVVVHQATALRATQFGRNLDRTFADTNQLRTVGTDALLAAAQEVGAPRIVAQSFAPSRYARVGGPVKSEDDPLEPDPPRGGAQTYAAMEHLERVVTDAGGTALRYGGFYGDVDDALITPISKRQFPIVGDGGGIMSFVHLDDAAAATVLAVEQHRPGIYNIVDDEPAPVREWLPVLAAALGAGPPRHVPRWLARVVAGQAAVRMGTEARGASNVKAKRELGWVPQHATWRDGFAAAYAGFTNGERLAR